MSFDSLADWQASVDRVTAEVWARNGSAMAFNPLNEEMGVAEVLPEEMEDDAAREERVMALQKLLDYLWAAGQNPIAVLKRLFVITRYISPTHLAHMNQSQVAVLLNETRAATQLREKREWEKFLKESGFLGRRTRLQKSDEARAAYQEVQQGNACRLGGKAAQKKYSLLRQKKKINKKSK